MDKEGVKPARGWTECPHPAHKKVVKEAACSIHLKKKQKQANLHPTKI